jgi:hypothetical protein
VRPLAEHKQPCRTKCERAGFEPVSTQMQPVSTRCVSQISDIDILSSRDLSPDSCPSAQDGRNSSPETKLLATNLRKCRLFAKFKNSPEETALAG